MMLDVVFFSLPCATQTHSLSLFFSRSFPLLTLCHLSARNGQRMDRTKAWYQSIKQIERNETRNPFELDLAHEYRLKPVSKQQSAFTSSCVKTKEFVLSACLPPVIKNLEFFILFDTCSRPAQLDSCQRHGKGRRIHEK